MKDTLDKGAIFRCMTLCYEAHQSEKPSLEELSPTEEGSVLKSARSLAVVGGSILQGFVVRFYRIFFARIGIYLFDIAILLTIGTKALSQ